jgi:hypothetical protein
MLDLKYRPSMCGMRIDFTKIAARALVPAWLPDGRRQGREWIAHNPKRADRHLGSFSVPHRPPAADPQRMKTIVVSGRYPLLPPPFFLLVNLVTGRWADFAVAGAKARDLISLRAYLDDISQSEAPRRIAMEIGHDVINGNAQGEVELVDPTRNCSLGGFLAELGIRNESYFGRQALLILYRNRNGSLFCPTNGANGHCGAGIECLLPPSIRHPHFDGG